MPARHPPPKQSDQSARAQAKIKLAETNFAIAFLKALKANWHNAYLLAAVVAWLREASNSQSGSFAGNNPFGLTHNGGKLIYYASLGEAASAFARTLMASKTAGIAGVIMAAQRQATTDPAMQKQATDFLTGVAMSDYDRMHYNAPDGALWTNHLIALWSKVLVGYSVTFPGTPGKPAVPQTRPKPPPVRPCSRVPPTSRTPPLATSCRTLSSSSTKPCTGMQVVH